VNNFSIVIPIYNEGLNIHDLLDGILNSLSKHDYTYEIIFVDDGSQDNTKDIFSSKKLFTKLIKEQKIKLIENNKNLGQSFSITKGIKNCKYNTIVTLDGDGQNDPKDIPKLIDIFFSKKSYSLIGGIRKKRNDNYIKIFSSKIANKVRRFILNDDCEDTGCSLKVFDKNIFIKFPYFNGIHRFLPALFKGYGKKTFFIDVNHKARLKGQSKYGTIGRLFRGIRDIIRVVIIINNLKKL
tara:strand:- start:955 stop:1671 length:717 start_codon:yes stop_codon:yes gene_type:complete